MLILGRTKGEEIWLTDTRTGEETKVVIFGIDRGEVAVGILAPKPVMIERAEVREKRLCQKPENAQR